MFPICSYKLLLFSELISIFSENNIDYLTTMYCGYCSKYISILYELFRRNHKLFMVSDQKNIILSKFRSHLSIIYVVP